MKKKYIIPTICTVPLVAEENILTGSTTFSGPPVEDADPEDTEW